MSDQLASYFQIGLRIRSLRLLAVMLLFLSLRADTAAQDPSPQARSAPAQWITSPGAPPRDVTMLHFRKEIELEKVPEHFLVDVSADNRFLLMVNQQRRGAGPARGDLAHWRYVVYDLAPVLHAGKNVLPGTVWYPGTVPPVAQI